MSISQQQQVSIHERQPLCNNTNDLRVSNSASNLDTVKSGQSRAIRRKASNRAFQNHMDSSESIPSHHSSLCEATFVGPGNDSIECPGTPVPFINSSRPSTPSKASSTPTRSPISTTAVPQNRSVHHPTPLETITERDSKATLRPNPSTTFSLHQKLSHLSFTRVYHQDPKTEPQKSLGTKLLIHRKQSFSVDDIPDLYPVHKRHTSSSSTEPFPASTAYPFLTRDHQQTIPPYPYPHSPSHPPPIRDPTPPGLPTFNTPASETYRLSPPPLHFRDFFRLRPTPAEEEYMAQTMHLPRGAVMRGTGEDSRVLVRGRWRWGGGRNVWGATAGGGEVGLNGHPLQRRFAGSGVVDVASGNGNGNRNVAERSGVLSHTEREKGRMDTVPPPLNIPAGSENAVPGGDGRPHGKTMDRVLCYVCCGADKDEGADEAPRLRRSWDGEVDLARRHLGEIGRGVQAGMLGAL